MKHAFPAALIVLLSGCATSVYHPQKTEAQMQADVNLCTRVAHDRHPLDSVSALFSAYNCLDAKGYSRTNQGLAMQVEQASGDNRRRSPKQAAQPCRVPCR